jgi:preprotein translocase subunit SecD
MLAVLAGLIVVLFLAVVGGDVASPGKWSGDFRVRLGLDLTSGTTVALQAVKPGGGTPASDEMQRAIQIMDNRVNGAGVTEAQVQQQGKDIINVSVPGQNAQTVVSRVSRTAELQFRQVLLVAPNTSPAASPSPSASASPSSPAATSPSPSASGAASPAASATPSAAPTSATSTWQQAQGDAALVSAPVKVLFNKLNCADKDWQKAIGYTRGQYNDRNLQIVSCDSAHNKFVLDKAHVVGDMIASASATPLTSSNAWQVNLSFKSDGAKAFGDLTTQMYSKYGTSGSPLDDLAVVLDGGVVSFPAINQGPITGGQAQITGSFNQEEATTLANQLSYGALPLSFHVQSVQSVSPELGRDQLNAGLIAGGLGLLLVVFYLLLYYRGLAVVAVFSLVTSAVLTYLSVVLLGKYQGFALSLAGIAGLIVAIGITADSFVIFFERLRDEVRDGRSLRAAVERGWARARRTILVSDTVSFLAAALLYYFAIGGVRGFAFTLGLTTVIDVVVVFTFTKPVMTLLARTKFYGQGHPLSGLDPRRLGARAPWRASPRAAARVPARATPAKEV